MTDKTMKERHDDFPSSANDTTAEYYFQAVKDLASALSDPGLNKTQLGNLIDAVMGYTDSLNSLSSRIDDTDDNVATNAQDISDIQETLGNLITESPGDIQWEAVSSAVNEGSNVTIRLNRVNYGIQPPDATYTSTVTWADDAPIAGDSMELDGVAYTPGANIDWTQSDLFHVITYKSSSDSITSDGTVTLTSAAASPMGDGSPVLNTLTITNDGATSAPGTFAFVSSGYSDTEERSPVQTLTIGRSGGSDGDATINYTLANISAVAGENYVQHTSSSIVISDGDVSGTIDVQTVHNGITSNKSLSCTIDSVSVGAIGAQNSTTITINKLAGFWSQPASAAGSADGDVDWNTIDVDTQLTLWTGAVSGTITADKYRFDFSGDSAETVGGLQVNGTAVLTLSNCYLAHASKAIIRTYQNAGATIRNCSFQYSHERTTSVGESNPAIYILNGKDHASTGSNEINNNIFINTAGDCLFYEEDGAEGDEFLYNFSYGADDPDRWNAGNQGPGFFMYIFGGGQLANSIKCNHNTWYSPAEAYGGTHRYNEDIFTFQRTSGVAGWHEAKYNRVFGTNSESSSSQIYQFGDGASVNNTVWKFNVSLQFSHMSHGLSYGTDHVLSNNRSFCSESEPMSGDNSVGIGQLQRSSNESPGDVYDNTFSYNESMCYRGPTGSQPLTTIQDYWYPSSGSDGFYPNYGSVACSPASTNCFNEETPTGWGSTRGAPGTNEMGDDSHRWNGNSGQDGYDALINRRRVMKQPANVSFIMVENASHDAAIGPGTLSYDGAGSLTWTEQGDTAGTAVDLTGTNPDTGATYAVGDMFFITTGSHDSGSLKEFKTIECILTASASGGSASDTDIMVTAIEHYKSPFWAGENGDLS